MKKVVLALGCVAMFGLASCSKEKTCQCSYEFMGDTHETEEFVVEEGDCDEGLPDGASAWNSLECEEV